MATATKGDLKELKGELKGEIRKERREDLDKLEKKIAKDRKKDFEDFAIIVKKGFDEMNERFDEMDKRFDRMEEKFDKSEDKIAGLMVRIDNTEKRLDLNAVEHREIQMEIIKIKEALITKTANKKFDALEKRVVMVEEKV